MTHICGVCTEHFNKYTFQPHHLLGTETSVDGSVNYLRLVGRKEQVVCMDVRKLGVPLGRKWNWDAVRAMLPSLDQCPRCGAMYVR